MVVHDPDTCYCFECSWRAWNNAAIVEAEEEENLRAKKMIVEIQKIRGTGEMPPFLGVCQRHFEKARPTILSKEAKLVAPLDMLDMMIPKALTDSIESIEIHYRKA